MSIESSMLSIDISKSAAAAKGGMFDALIGLGLRTGDGVGVRVFDVDERLRSCLLALSRWNNNFSLHLA
jgi:hypothetical protein